MNRHPSKQGFWKVAGCAVGLLAILATLGGHWMVLQSFAWARMISVASQQESLGTAIAKAFDGKHPCELCLIIQHGKSSEKKSDQEKPMGKMDGLLVVHDFALRGAAAYPRVVPLRRAFDKWLEAPPTPPPRWA